MKEIPKSKEGEATSDTFSNTSFLKIFKNKKESSVQKYFIKFYMSQESES